MDKPMNHPNRSRTAVIVGALITGWGLGSSPGPVAATDLPPVLVVVESASLRTNTLLEEMIGTNLAPHDQPDRRPSVSKPSPADHSLTTPIIVVYPDGRTSQHPLLLQEELMMRQVVAPDHSLGPRTPTIILQYGERRLEMPLALPSPFIFDPAHGILVFDVPTLTPSETYTLTSYLLTAGEPTSQPLPPVDRPGPSLTGGPEPTAELLGFVRSLARKPDLWIFAVIGPALAVLGLMRRFRSNKSSKGRKSEKADPVASSGGGVPDDQEPAGAMVPECTENLPARRSAA